MISYNDKIIIFVFSISSLYLCFRLCVYAVTCRRTKNTIVKDHVVYAAERELILSQFFGTETLTAEDVAMRISKYAIDGGGIISFSAIVEHLSSLSCDGELVETVTGAEKNGVMMSIKKYRQSSKKGIL